MAETKASAHAIRVRLNQLLADHAGGEDDLRLPGATVGQVLEALTERHPGLAGLVWGPQGQFNEQLVAFVGQEDIRRLQGVDTPLHDGDELTVITAVEGG